MRRARQNARDKSYHAIEARFAIAAMVNFEHIDEDERPVNGDRWT